MADIVIIGAGQAGFSCAMRLRHKGFSGGITLIGDERAFPYQRPPLSKAYMLGKADDASLQLSGDTALSDAGITFFQGISVAAVNAGARALMLENGARMAYDVLVFATGSRARRLPDTMGMALDGVHTLRTVADAARLKAASDRAKSAVIIGGGFIGLEVAATLAQQGKRVTLIEIAPRILNRVAGETISHAVTQKHRDNGVEIITGIGLERLAGRDGVFEAAELADGRRIAADLALVGIGGLANDELATAAWLETRNGIVVDEQGCTSVPGIFAAGDCALFPIGGAMMRVESVQNAIDQANHVADAILGETAPYAPVPWFWSDQYDWKLQTAGLAVQPDAELAVPGHREGALAVWYLKNGVAVAVDTINDGKTHMAARRLFAAHATIDANQIAAPGFDPVALMKSLAA